MVRNTKLYIHTHTHTLTFIYKYLYIYYIYLYTDNNEYTYKNINIHASGLGCRTGSAVSYCSVDLLSKNCRKAFHICENWKRRCNRGKSDGVEICNKKKEPQPPSKHIYTQTQASSQEKRWERQRVGVKSGMVRGFRERYSGQKMAVFLHATPWLQSRVQKKKKWRK